MLAIFVVVVAVLPWPALGSDGAHPAVWRLEMKEGPSVSWHGSAVLIGTSETASLWATCRHNIRREDAKHVQAQVYVHRDGKRLRLYAPPLPHPTRNCDLALLLTEPASGIKPIPLAEQVTAAEPVQAEGYGALQFGRSTLHLRLSRRDYAEWDGGQNVTQGDSGGALIKRDGTLAGLVAGGNKQMNLVIGPHAGAIGEFVRTATFQTGTDELRCRLLRGILQLISGPQCSTCPPGSQPMFVPRQSQSRVVEAPMYDRPLYQTTPMPALPKDQQLQPVPEKSTSPETASSTPAEATQTLKPITQRKFIDDPQVPSGMLPEKSDATPTWAGSMFGWLAGVSDVGFFGTILTALGGSGLWFLNRRVADMESLAHKAIDVATAGMGPVAGRVAAKAGHGVVDKAADAAGHWGASRLGGFQDHHETEDVEDHVERRARTIIEEIPVRRRTIVQTGSPRFVEDGATKSHGRKRLARKRRTASYAGTPEHFADHDEHHWQNN